MSSIFMKTMAAKNPISALKNGETEKGDATVKNKASEKAINWLNNDSDPTTLFKGMRGTLNVAHKAGPLMKWGDKRRARRQAKGKPVKGQKNKGLVTRGGSCGPGGCNMFGK